jgi:hypothetical protein
MIAVSHDLDPEIRAELAGHVEDKLIAYLSGQERISEDDAFILVREHFGDPSRIKSLLQDVHRVDAGVSLTRRVCAIATVHFVFITVTSLASAASWSIAAWSNIAEWDARVSAALYPAIICATALVGTWVYWHVLKRWRRREQDGGTNWFQRLPAVKLAAVIAAVLGAHAITPSPSMPFDPGIVVPIPPSIFISLAALPVVVACSIYQAGLWLWWCDTPPRQPRTLTIAALAWMAVASVPWYHVVRFFHVELYSYDPSAFTPDLAGHLVLWHAHDGDLARLWTIGPASITYPSFSSLGLTIAFAVFVIALAKFAYRRLNPITDLSPS